MKKPKKHIKRGVKKTQYKGATMRFQRGTRGWWTLVGNEDRARVFGPEPLSKVRKDAIEFIDKREAGGQRS